MGQHSILAWFKQRAAIGGNEWLTFKETSDQLNEAGIKHSPASVNRQLRKLIKYGLLEKYEPRGCSFRVKVRYPEDV